MAKLYGDILSSALMTFDKSFARANGQPLDASEIYYSLDDAKAYAAGAGAYVGQKIVVVEDGVVTHYSIEDEAGTLKELGVKPVGDNHSIEVDEDGVVAIKDFGTGYYKYIPVQKDEDGNTVEGTGIYESELTEGFAENLTLKVRLASGGGYEVAWYAPNTDTTEGVLDTITGLNESLETLTGDVNDVQEDVVDLQTSIYGEGGTAENPAEGSIADNVNDLLEVVGGEDDILGENVDTLWANINDLKDRATAIEDDYLTSADKNELQDAIDAIEIPVLGVAADDKILALGTDKLIAATVSLDYDSDAKAIKLYGKDKVELGSVDATPFIKDGMLHDVDYNAENNTLTFTWNTDAGDKTDTVVLSDIIEPYTAGNGLVLEGNEFAAKLADGSEGFLTITEDGIKLAGVQAAINDAADTAEAEAIAAAEDLVDAAVEAIEADITELETALDARLDILEAIQHDTYATKTEVSELETAIDERLDVLEAIEHETFATKVEVEEIVNNNTTVVEGLQEQIDAIKEIEPEKNVIVGVKKNGELLTVGEDRTVDVIVPTKFSDLTDDSGFSGRIDSVLEIANQGVSDASAAHAAANKAQEEVDAVELEVGGIQTVVAGHTTLLENHAERIGALEQADIAHATEYSELKTVVTGHTEAIAKKADQTALNDAVAKIGANEAAIETLNNTTIPAINGEIAKKANAADVYTKDEVNGIIGTPAEGKTIVKMIEDAQKAATYDDTEVRGLITAEKERAEGVEADFEERIAEMENFWKAADDPVGTIDKLAEIVDYINSDTTGALDMAAAIKANADAIAEINDPDSGILAIAKKYTDDQIAAIPAVSAEKAGLVKVDDVSIKAEDGVIGVKAVSTDLLVQGVQELILNGGSAV